MNMLSIHPEKAVFMDIDHPRRQSKLPDLSPICLDNIRTKLVHETKYLGRTVDNSLSWNEQYCPWINADRKKVIRTRDPLRRSIVKQTSQNLGIPIRNVESR